MAEEELKKLEEQAKDDLEKLRKYAEKEPAPYLINTLAPPNQLRDELLNKITELEFSEKEFIKGYCDMTDRLGMTCDNLETVLNICEDNQKENAWLHKVNKILSFGLGIGIGLNIILLRKVFK